MAHLTFSPADKKRVEQTHLKFLGTVPANTPFGVMVANLLSLERNADVFTGGPDIGLQPDDFFKTGETGISAAGILFPREGIFAGDFSNRVDFHYARINILNSLLTYLSTRDEKLPVQQWINHFDGNGFFDRICQIYNRLYKRAAGYTDNTDQPNEDTLSQKNFRKGYLLLLLKNPYWAKNPHDYAAILNHMSGRDDTIVAWMKNVQPTMSNNLSPSELSAPAPLALPAPAVEEPVVPPAPPVIDIDNFSADALSGFVQASDIAGLRALIQSFAQAGDTLTAESLGGINTVFASIPALYKGTVSFIDATRPKPPVVDAKRKNFLVRLFADEAAVPVNPAIVLDVELVVLNRKVSSMEISGDELHKINRAAVALAAKLGSHANVIAQYIESADGKAFLDGDKIMGNVVESAGIDVARAAQSTRLIGTLTEGLAMRITDISEAMGTTQRGAFARTLGAKPVNPFETYREVLGKMAETGTWVTGTIAEKADVLGREADKNAAAMGSTAQGLRDNIRDYERLATLSAVQAQPDPVARAAASLLPTG